MNFTKELRSFAGRFSAIILSVSLVTVGAGCSESKECPFDSGYAFGLIEKQCSYGARVPGTAAHDSCVSLIQREMSLLCDTVYTQSFSRRVSYSKENMVFSNIICVMNPEGEKHIMLFSHFDSRPFSSVKNTPTMGANDGASSTAFLIAFAKMLKEKGRKEKFTFVFLDGEDGGTLLHSDEWFIGSSYFAENYSDKLPDEAILLDMIGDKDLKIMKEGYSDLANRGLNKKIFDAAKRVKSDAFDSRIGYFVEDDHIPLNRKGFRCVDIIDMNYKWWHTPEDTPDKCSASSLEKVAEVMEEAVLEE